MINPIWLRSFCTLVEIRHFTQTAKKLHMTQSGVSQHIHKLEALLDTPLLVREGKQFTLTEAGERLYQRARAIVLELSELDQLIKEDPAYEGEVRMMSPGSVGLKLYPRLLQLQQNHPGLCIDYRFAPNADIERAIADLSVDIGLLTRPSGLAEVHCTKIAEEPLLLVTPKSNVQPTWQDLQKLGFIGHPDGAHHAQLLLSANYSEFQHSSQFKQKGYSNQINLILEPVCMGLGFTVLPAYAVEAFQKKHLVNAHSLSKKVTETLYMGTRKGKEITNRMKSVINEFRKWI